MKLSLVTATIALLALGLTGTREGWAQGTPILTLTGVVTDAETGEPLPGANVFIAGSLRGTSTSRDGSYRLEGVPVGAMRLFASMIGYEPQARDMLLRTETARTIDFVLTPSVYELEGIAVEGKADRRWTRQFEQFRDLFIGKTPNASETEITNLYVLDFDGSGGELVASAQKPLEIENRALGYRIQYFLEDFSATRHRTKYDGEPLYEELEPSSEEEAKRWDRNRRKAFIGSFRHFLLALIAGRTEEQGFKTYARMEFVDPAAAQIGGPAAGTRFPIDPSSMFRPGSSPHDYVLDFDGFVEIAFTGELEDTSYFEWSKQPRRKPRYQTSWIRLERGPTTFDWKGDVLDPYGVTYYGYLAFERVADEVPREYRPS